MRSVRALALLSWGLVLLLAAAGFAAFSTRDARPAPTTVESEEPARPIVIAEPSARVAAYLFANSLDFRGEFPERFDPPSPLVRLGPDGSTTTTSAAPSVRSLEVADETEAAAETTEAPTTTAAQTTTTSPATTTTHTHAPTTTTTTEPSTTTTHTHAPTTTTTTEPPTATTEPGGDGTTTTTTEAAGDGTTTTTTEATGGGRGNVEGWRPLVETYFAPGQVENALVVMRCESNGDPNAVNSRSGAAGLFQFMPGTWNWASEQAGFGGSDPFHAEANIAAAAWLVEYSTQTGHPRGPWGHWTCRP